MMAEAACVMRDVAELYREHAGKLRVVRFETHERGHESTRLRELKPAGRERGAGRRLIDLESSRVARSAAADARERTQIVDVRGERKAHGDRSTQLTRQPSRERALGSDEHDGAARAGSDQPREQRSLKRLDGRHDEAMIAIRDLNSAPTPQLVDGSVERQRSGVAVYFLFGWGRHRKGHVFRWC
jgi:hypothetical protein